MSNKKVLFWGFLYVFMMWALLPLIFIGDTSAAYFSIVVQSHIVVIAVLSVVCFISWLSVKAGY